MICPHMSLYKVHTHQQVTYKPFTRPLTSSFLPSGPFPQFTFIDSLARP